MHFRNFFVVRRLVVRGACQSRIKTTTHFFESTNSSNTRSYHELPHTAIDSTFSKHSMPKKNVLRTHYLSQVVCVTRVFVLHFGLAVPERRHTSSQSGGGQQLSGCAGAHQRECKRERKNSLGMVRPVAFRTTKVRERSLVSQAKRDASTIQRSD